ncbi:CRISPR-associated helicase Cas3' [Actinotignum urinale]|uniref:CRISPR-associated helicase Cas3' n=1 Tax=Actinotignum urinale TaxID=190146 RepID=UPI00280AF911|nr:CRISPR-associated helicase Cas3' [Actinotignum urinale]
MESNLEFTWPSQTHSLWAKTGHEGMWLSLPQHLEDSAHVSGWLWDTWLPPHLRHGISAQLELNDEQTRHFVTFLAGTHDVGKASPCFTFQLRKSKYPTYLNRVEKAGFEGPQQLFAERYPHSVASHHITSSYLKEKLFPEGAFPSENSTPSSAAMPSQVVSSIAHIAGSHHGLPTDAGSYNHCKAEFSRQSDLWKNTQDGLMEAVIIACHVEDILRQLIEKGTAVSSYTQMILTGIVIMSDWIASNQDLFPLLPEPREGGAKPLQQKEQNLRVERALADLKLPSYWHPSQMVDQASQAYRTRFGWPEATNPYTVQDAAFRVAHEAQGPIILCVEAAMGEGKTEAALMAAEILAEKNGCGGLAFAAPSQATANGLFARVRSWAEASKNQVFSMYLAHGKNTMNDEFASLAESVHNIYDESDTGKDESDKEKDVPSTVIAHNWLSGRKKGLLASITVMTVDQILMVALQSKHAMLRHLGLAGKVVVIDEVHAYDSYMTVYLQRALEWLGSYGAPVILLSATLPEGIRRSLLTAYVRGARHTVKLNWELPQGTPPDAYPLISWAGASYDAVQYRGVEPSGRKYNIDLYRIEDDDDSLRELLSPVSEEGGCVAVICTTVKRAQHAYRIAQELVGEDARLMHSAFVASDRSEAEKLLFSELGPNVHKERPWRRIIVATQVIEQSLDVDFDCIITDIAPIDLLLQRLGRLHRHQRSPEERPAWAQNASCYVRGVEDPGIGFSPKFNDSIEFIYEPSVLMSTWNELQPYLKGKTLILPADIPELVHAVYPDEIHENRNVEVSLPDEWLESFKKAYKEHKKNKKTSETRAETFRFPSPSGIKSFSSLWSTQTRDVEKSVAGEEIGIAQVRDTKPTVEVVVTVEKENGYYSPLPWVYGESGDVCIARNQLPDRDIAYALATSTVRLPLAMTKENYLFEAVVEELEKGTDPAWKQSSLLRGQLQLRLDSTYRTTINNFSLEYSRELGLIHPSEKTLPKE